jgi:hypothetical protein
MAVKLTTVLEKPRQKDDNAFIFSALPQESEVFYENEHIT